MADNIPITSGSGTNVATDDVSSVHFQRIKRQSGGDGVATDFLDASYRSDTFTTTGNGVTVNVSTQGMGEFTVQVVPTGAVTSWDVRLEGSVDGTNFTTILTHTHTVPGANGHVFMGAGRAPCRHFRSRVHALTLGAGTNIVVHILGRN